MLESLIEEHPGDEVVVATLSFVYSQVDEPTRAFWLLRKALQQLPDSYLIHVNIASYYDRRGDYETALAHLDRPIELMCRSLRAVFLCLALTHVACTDRDTPPNGGTQACPPWFEDQAQRRGLVFQYRSGHPDRYLFPEMLGGGATLADLDNDGDLDVYLVQGGPLRCAAIHWIKLL